MYYQTETITNITHKIMQTLTAKQQNAASGYGKQPKFFRHIDGFLVAFILGDNEDSSSTGGGGWFFTVWSEKLERFIFCYGGEWTEKDENWVGSCHEYMKDDTLRNGAIAVLDSEGKKHRYK